jgi:hypothetical protein
MSVTYDEATVKWTAVHDQYTNIQVSGPTREGVEQRLAELAARYQQVHSLRESKPEARAHFQERK